MDRAVNDSENINRAIAAHARWKMRLRQSIESGKSDVTVSDVQSDARCEFSKWLATCTAKGAAAERLKQIKALHTEFHRQAARILEMALSGRKSDASAALALGSSFSQLSADLTLALARWRDGVPDHRG